MGKPWEIISLSMRSYLPMTIDDVEIWKETMCFDREMWMSKIWKIFAVWAEDLYIYAFVSNQYVCIYICIYQYCMYAINMGMGTPGYMICSELRPTLLCCKDVETADATNSIDAQRFWIILRGEFLHCYISYRHKSLNWDCPAFFGGMEKWPKFWSPSTNQFQYILVISRASPGYIILYPHFCGKVNKNAGHDPPHHHRSSRSTFKNCDTNHAMGLERGSWERNTQD